jgi:hypothetical protein
MKSMAYMAAMASAGMAVLRPSRRLSRPDYYQEWAPEKKITEAGLKKIAKRKAQKKARAITRRAK